MRPRLIEGYSLAAGVWLPFGLDGDSDMRNDPNRPILYIDKHTDAASKEAKRLLKRAGFDVDVKIAPTYYRSACGAPVLFGLFTKFQGLDGIRSFLKNATRPQGTLRHLR